MLGILLFSSLSMIPCGRVVDYFFFFQAEDGIRYGRVTGVQTCALPISARRPASSSRPAACSARASSSAGGRSRLPTWSARNGGSVRADMPATYPRRWQARPMELGAMELGVVTFLTDYGIGATALAGAVEERGFDA